MRQINLSITESLDCPQLDFPYRVTFVMTHTAMCSVEIDKFLPYQCHKLLKYKCKSV